MHPIHLRLLDSKNRRVSSKLSLAGSHTHRIPSVCWMSGIHSRETSESIARVLTLKLTQSRRVILLEWIHMMPKDMVLVMIKRWVAHISFQWITGTPTERCPSFVWVKTLYEYFVNSLQTIDSTVFNSSIVSQSFHTNRYLLVRRRGVPSLSKQYQYGSTQPFCIFRPRASAQCRR